MSNGRVELGIGTGWNQAEHDAYGIPFGASFGERFEWLSEQLEIIIGLWTTPVGQTFSFEGKHYTLKESPALPKPVRKPRPPVILGGFGAKRTPRLAARYADEYNLPFMPLNLIAERIATVREACEKSGRDPATLLLSTAQTVCVGADEAEFVRRAEAIGQPPDRIRTGGVAGTPAQAVEQLGKLADLGITRTYLQFLDLTDHDHLRLVAEVTGVGTPLGLMSAQQAPDDSGQSART
jgi:alkanesulfonate monooxygenase SsuD/methylene tetrahydromethanopterin reductase-like flavin-dependent oxidoreductase (luciferase family)